MNPRDRSARFAVRFLDMASGPESFRGRVRAKAHDAVSDMATQDLAHLGISKKAQALFLETLEPATS